jgi:hypothetical protein
MQSDFGKLWVLSMAKMLAESFAHFHCFQMACCAQCPGPCFWCTLPRKSGDYARLNFALHAVYLASLIYRILF